MNSKESIVLDYHPSLHEFYQKLADLPGFVLLESQDHRNGRYDILTAYPYDRIEIRDNTANKLELLEILKQKLMIQPSSSDLPFQGGAIGYISYDLGAQLFGIHAQAQSGLQDIPLLDLGFYDWAIITDHYLKTVTIFAAHRHESTEEITKKIVQLWNSTAPVDKAFWVKTEFKPLIAKESYQKSYAAIAQALKEGRSYQVNYTQPFHASYEGCPWEIYKKISVTNPVPFACFIKTEATSILSFSPERFLLYDQGRLLTSPIKGTIGRSVNPLEDEQLKMELASCPKNRAENVMIVDLLRNDLGKIAAVGSVQVQNLCSIQSYNSVHHLVTDIEAQCLDFLHPFDAFFSCFPGGSITGAPKLEAMRIINEQEPYARGIYCGSIGYFSLHGRFDTNIAIRTVTAKDGILHLAAGGGIVIDSDCEDEYRECYTKIAAIINGLKS